MLRHILLVSAAWAGLGSVSFAQQAATAAPAAAEPALEQQGEIVVTATRRAERVSDIPLAVTAVTAESLLNSGASDIRQLTQLSPSLLVSSTSSEAGAGVARIRGVGTVGDNPGLESSVGVFIDGVYRNRSGVALSELGPVERIEVLRGPQGTLFGRNVSAGLINITTAAPKFENEGYASFTVQNYDGYRVEGGFTGPIAGGDKLAARFDGVYFTRDGFIRDVYTNKRYNDRQRYLLRGQLLYRPTTDFSFRLIGDYAKRNEQCCASIYAPLISYTRAPGTPTGQLGTFTTGPAAFASVLRSFRDSAGNPVYLNDNIKQYRTAVTPGQNYQSDVEDWGLSGEANWDLHGVKLTSITAYREWRWTRGQDADFNNLDILNRQGYRQSFRTFSQELRAQGELFKGRLNWLVGGYFANEDLNVKDRLRFGADYDSYVTTSLRLSNPALASFPGFSRLNLFAQGALAAQGVPAPVIGIFAPLVPNLTINNVGATNDRYYQNSRNFAFFTHNQIKITDRLGITLGGRYTNERKRLNMNLASDNTSCAAIQSSIANVTAVGVANPALAAVANGLAGNLRGLAAIPCLINNNTLFDVSIADARTEEQFTGTAVASWKPVDSLLVYGGYSRGYKAGGYNLDRSALTASRSAADLRFTRETVDAYEVGLKFNTRKFDMNVALFRQEFQNFQLNTFNGVNFIVENINGCAGATNAPATGFVRGSCPSKLDPGLVSQGVEVEAFAYPMRNLSVNAGVTYADTRYSDRAVGANGRALANTLYLLPGQQLSNAPDTVVTGAVTFTPPVGSAGYSALFYFDGRWSSGYNTGSDLEITKYQSDFALFNARIGLRAPKQAWSLEFWATNLFDKRYTQVAFDAPLQPLGGTRPSQVTNLPAGTTFAANQSSSLYGRFPGEPRQFGLTVRTTF